MSGDSVRVAVRVRPFNGREKDRNAQLIIAMNGNQTVITNPHNNEEKKFTFDFSYWSHDNYDEGSDGMLIPTTDKYADQKHVFDTLGMDVLNNAYAGYNCSLFAYGQTGSGKSFSMVGYGVNKGIVPISCDTIFKGIAENSDPNKKYQVSLSMLEIYNEAVRDLLSSEKPTKGGLKVRQHPKLGVQVVGLKEVPVSSYDEINARIEAGTSSRTVASTNMNATSSRAHTVVAIMYTQIEKDGKGPGKDKSMTSKINLVDLAGSERAESTGATGDRLKEGAAINLSLSMLGNVIKALADKSNNPKAKILIPYRDSKLTQILQDALGGNSKTIMIAALSPADINYEETLSTLRYADRAKQIKNKAVVNIDPTEQLIAKLKEENEKLMAQLKAATGGGDFDPSLFGGGESSGAAMTEEEKEEMRRKIQEEMAAELAENQRLMEEQAQSWEAKLESAKAEYGAGDQKKKEEEEKRARVPHMVNVNEDPSLSGMVVKFFEEGESTIGRRDADEPQTIVLGGLSIQKKHAAVRHEAGKVRVVAIGEAKLLVNGKQLDPDTEHELHHNDRVMIGANHLNIFRNPAEATAESIPDVDTTWDDAQDEIAKGQGFAAETRDLSKLTQAEIDHVLLQDEIVRLVPLVAEANDIAVELGRDNTFEVKLVNKPTSNGKFKTEVAVIMKVPSTGQSWMWTKPKFINRHAMFKELYEHYAMDGEIPELTQDKDPFWEPEEPVLIGNAYAYLNPLSYGIELESQATVRDYKGKDEGVLNITVHPMAADCEDPTSEEAEFLVDDPSELLGKSMYVRVAIESGRAFNSKFAEGLHVEWTWGPFTEAGEPERFVTPVVKGTANPDWKYIHKIHIPSITREILTYFDNGAICFSVFGLQSSAARPATAPRKAGGAAAEASALRMKLQELEVEFEKKVADLQSQIQSSQGESRVTKGRLERMLKRNNEASRLVAKYKTEGALAPDNAAAIQKLIKPGGLSKFKAAAKLVGATQVAKKNSEAGGGDDKGSKSCAVQ